MCAENFIVATAVDMCRNSLGQFALLVFGQDRQIDCYISQYVDGQHESEILRNELHIETQ